MVKQSPHQDRHQAPTSTALPPPVPTKGDAPARVVAYWAPGGGWLAHELRGELKGLQHWLEVAAICKVENLCAGGIADDKGIGRG